MLRGSLAVLVLGCGIGTASADDVVRLGGVGSLNDATASGDIMRLDGTFMDDAETQLVHRRWGFGFGWGRGWYGHSFGFGLGRYYGGYGGYGYRPYYSSFYRPWGGYYRPYAWGGWGGYYRPYYSSFYYPSYSYSSFYYPSYSYYAPYYSSYAYPVYSSYWSPCAADGLVMPEATTLGSGSSSARVERAMPRADDSGADSDGAYDYDGGPERVVPMPGSNSAPMVAPPPRPMLPRKGRLVSLPAAESLAGGFSAAQAPAAQAYEYRAYGETESPRKQPVRVTDRAAPAPTFPAYGETTGGTAVLTGAAR